jgi:hypothetical protein
VDVPRLRVSAMNKDAAAAETARPGTMEDRWRREKGLFPQPEFRLVTMTAILSPADLLAKKRDRIP